MMKLLGPQATFHIVVLTVRRTDFAQIASKAQVENETFLTQPVTPSLPYQKQVPQVHSRSGCSANCDACSWLSPTAMIPLAWSPRLT